MRYEHTYYIQCMFMYVSTVHLCVCVCVMIAAGKLMWHHREVAWLPMKNSSEALGPNGSCGSAERDHSVCVSSVEPSVITVCV